jgi:hypothetical protein
LGAKVHANRMACQGQCQQLDCKRRPKVQPTESEGQMEPMLPFLAEERMHTLQRDGALVRRARRRAPRRRLVDALMSRADGRSARDV